MKITLYLMILMWLLCQCNHNQVESRELDCSNAMVILKPFKCDLNEDFARCSQREGEYSIALVIFKKCLHQCDTTFELLMNTGDCLFKLDSTEQAEKHFTLALELEPNDNNAHFNMAVLYYYGGEPKKAERHIQQAMKYSESESANYYGLASEIQFALNNLDKAEKLILKAMELDPTNLYYSLRYGYILEAIGRYQETIDLTNHVLRSESLDTHDLLDFLDLKSTSLLSLGDSIEACKITNEIYELYPNFEFSDRFSYCDE